MSDSSTERAVPDEGAASPCLQEAVADLREALDRYDFWPEDSPLSTTAAVLNAARDLVTAIAAEREACTIRTVDQLNALPPQSVIQSDRSVTGDDNPWTWERFDEGWFTTAFDPTGVPDLPALLLWHPDWSAQ